MLRKIKAESIGKYFLVLVIISLYVFIILKAFHSSFTHDESLTFKILNGDKGVAGTANNHLLNTWLMTFFYWIFGPGEFILRLPNILAFGLYAFFTYRILSRSGSLVLLLAGTALMFFNPYLIDFFAIARGYGLSLGFAMGAVYYLLITDEDFPEGNYLTNFAISLAFSILSAYSNMVMLNFSIAIIIIFLFRIFYVNPGSLGWIKGKKGVVLFRVLIITFIFLSILVVRLFILKGRQQLYFGVTGFYSHTISQLIHHSIYFSSYSESFWQTIRHVIIVLFGLGILFQFFRNQYSPFTKITALIVLLVIASFIQFRMFNIPFPTGRTAVFFIPFYGLFVSYLLLEISKINLKYLLFKVTSSVPGFLMFLALTCHCATNMNLKYTREWYYDANTKAVMGEIKSLADNSINPGQNSISLSNTWLFEPTLNYYRALYGMDYLIPAHRDGLNRDSDFIYCTLEDYEVFEYRNFYQVLKEFDDTETVLLQRLSSE